MPFDNPKPKVDSDLVKRLKEAKARIHRGWCQGHAVKLLPSGEYNFCMHGAVVFNDVGRAIDPEVRVFDPYSIMGRALAAMDLAVKKLTCLPRNNVPDFNDWPDTIKEDCELIFDIAIEIVERDEQKLPI